MTQTAPPRVAMRSCPLWSFSADSPLVVLCSGLPVQFSSCGSSFDTYLRIFSTDMAIELHGCDDCGACGSQSVLDAALPEGNYTLVIEGGSGQTGDYTVTMNCPDDGFLDGNITCGDTRKGTTVGSGSHVGNAGSDHHYRFTLPAGRNLVVFDSCDSQFDTYLRVYDAVTSSEIVSCDDCGPCGLQTKLDAVLDCRPTAGATTCSYSLIIEGFSSNEGEYSVTMNCMPAVAQLASLPCDSTQTGSTFQGDAFFTMHVDAQGIKQLDTAGSSYDTYLRILQADTGSQLWSAWSATSHTVTTPAHMDATIDAGDYLVVVEGRPGDMGDFSLSLACPGNDQQVRNAYSQKRLQPRESDQPTARIDSSAFAGRLRGSVPGGHVQPRGRRGVRVPAWRWDRRDGDVPRGYRHPRRVRRPGAAGAAGRQRRYVLDERRHVMLR